ncbi:hypothetical protein [Halorussus salinus]|uniref:hypothetical protein n=1 Tax=Halorussus salinus TaxID=1364935 RepID=UPI001091B9A5|nr:hypothetical protein [Halorussus salinus]
MSDYALSNWTKAQYFWVINLLVPALATVLTLFTDIVSASGLIVIFSSILLLELTIAFDYLHTKVDNMDKEHQDHFKNINRFVENRASIEEISEWNFYDRFMIDVRNADRHVYISYFHNENPLNSNNNDQKEYYNKIGEITKEKADDNVEFKRLIRALPQHESWIEKMKEEHEGDRNFSLACIPDNEPEKGNTAYIPVQLIDRDTTYFVAVGEQRELAEPRDTYVQSKELNKQWTRYYDRLWKDSFEIISRGKVQHDEVEKYEKHLEKIEGCNKNE